MSARDFELGSVIESRYRIDQCCPRHGRGSAYFATHLESGGHVKLVEVPDTMVRALSRTTLVEHPALATLYELILVPDGRTFAVVGYVAGRTLQEELEDKGTLSAQTAVGYASTLAESLGELHRCRTSHGLLQPASVVLEGKSRLRAVLSYAPLPAGANPYLPPEQNTAAPSPADDVWGLAALLHTALLGHPPPRAGYTGRTEIIDAGLNDAALADLLSGCLATRRANRISLIQPVRDALAAWSPDPSEHHPPVSRLPPRGPEHSGSPAVAISLRPRRRSARARWGLGLLSAAVLGAAAWFLLRGNDVGWRRDQSGAVTPAGAARSSSPSSAATEPARVPPSSAPPGAAAPIASDAVSVDALPSAEEVTRCVVRQFPPDTFLETPNMEWLCSTRDPRIGAEQMQKILSRGAGPDRTSDALKGWRRLGWYGMGAFAVVQQGCCKQATAALELPIPLACPSAAPTVEQLALDVARGQPHDAALAEYREAMTCQSLRGREARFRLTSSIAAAQEEAFIAFLSARQAH